MRILKYLQFLLLLNLIMSSHGFTYISVERHLKHQISWSSCNKQNICYSIKTDDVEIGLLANFYYTGSTEVEILKKLSDGTLKSLKKFYAEEGRWDYDRNQWVLCLDSKTHPPKEIIIFPETLLHL